MKNTTNSTKWWKLVSFILFLPILVTAQKFGDVSALEVAETEHPTFKDAKAAYLVKNCDVYYDFEGRSTELVSDYFVRIKIYNEEGLDEFGNYGIYLGKNGSDKEFVTNLKAKTYTMVDGHVEETDLKKKEIFKEKGSEHYNFTTFAFPNVKVGSVIEVKYKLRSPFAYSTPRHYFQADIPVAKSKFSMAVPRYITMGPVATGSVGLKQEKKHISSRNEERYTFTANDVPPILDDDYVLNIKDFKSSLKYEIHSTDFPRSSPRTYSESWESIADRLEENSSFGKMLKTKVKSAKSLLNEVKDLDYDQKIVSVYNYIRSNVSWNKDYGIYSEQKPEKTLSSKTGNVSEVNLLLVNLLKKAGVMAYPVVTKRRFDGILNQYYPSVTSLNYVYVAIPRDEGYIFLDATSKYSPVGELPIRAMNINGLLIDGKNSKLIYTPNDNIIKIKEIAKLDLDPEELALVGSGTIKLSGYAATKSRMKSDEDEEDEDNQDLEGDEEDEEEDDNEEEGLESEDDDDMDDEDDEVDLREDDYDYTNTEGFDDVYSPISTEYNATLYNAVQGIGTEIFVDAFVIQEFNDNPFVDEVREFPAYFNSKHDHTYVTLLNIPSGYKLESSPKDVSIVMEGGSGQFIYTTTADDKKISVRCVLKIKKSAFLPADYDVLRRFFDTILDKQKEKFIFKKI